jgi:hypothetical protein
VDYFNEPEKQDKSSESTKLIGAAASVKNSMLDVLTEEITLQRIQPNCRKQHRTESR